MAKAKRSPLPRLIYQHTPNVIEKFGPEDLHTSYYPLPGIDFHNNPKLAQWVERYGAAPDPLFRQGLAAPPLGNNQSGLRHYTAEFLGDPQRVLNLDLPLASQTPAVAEALQKMGIRQHGDLTTPETLWRDAALQHGGYEGVHLSPEDLFREGGTGFNGPNDLASWVASGDPAADAVRNNLAPIVLDRLAGAGIPAASRMGPGWGAGTGFAPSSAGKSPLKLLEDEAAAARADGDVFKAQEIENILAGDEPGVYSERLAGDGTVMQAPTDGTREYKVFDPNAVSIRRIASILAALGVGGAVANADDRYGDRTSRFSAEPTPSTQPVDPAVSAWTESPAGIGGSTTMLPASGDGRSLAEYAKNRIVDEDLPAADVQAFQAELPPEHAEFSKNFDSAMQMPVVHLGAEVTTPDEFVQTLAAEYATRGYFSPTAVDNVKRMLQGLPLELPQSPILADQEKQLVGRIRDGLLDQIRETLPSGSASYGWEAGATPAQVEEFRKNDPTGTEGRWMLTSEGQQAFQAERVLNLLSTFQNGRHRPMFADRGSRYVANLAAAMPFPRAEGDPMSELASNRLNTPEGRMRESLYWWGRGEPDGTAMHSATGAKYPSVSSTTLEGIATKLDSPDHWLPHFSQQLFEQGLYNTDLSSEDFAKLQQLRNDQLRAVTPHIPVGADREELRRLRRDLRDFQMNSRGWANANAPLYTKYIPTPQAWAGPQDSASGPGEQTWPQAWAGGRNWYANLTPDERDAATPKPTFLSPVGEMAANLPRDVWDLQTAGMLGAGLLSGLARRGVRAAGQVAARAALDIGSDMPQEVGTGTIFAAVNARNDAGGESPSIFEPQQRSLVTYTEGPRMGFPVPADDPNYAYYLDRAGDTRKNVLRDILDRGTKLYGSQLTAPPVRPAPRPSSSPSVLFGS